METKACLKTHTHMHTHHSFSLPGEPYNTEELIRIADKRTVGSGCLSEFIVISSEHQALFKLIS